MDKFLILNFYCFDFHKSKSTVKLNAGQSSVQREICQYKKELLQERRPHMRSSGALVKKKKNFLNASFG